MIKTVTATDALQGDKFVIEIEDVYEQGNPTLYRIKGFNSLVFDARGLDKVPQLVDGIHPRSYNKGMEAAWEILKEVIEIYAETRTGPCGTYADVLDKHSRNKIISIMGNGPYLVREKLESWKEKHKQPLTVEQQIRQEAYEECCISCPQARKCHEDCSEDECEKFKDAMLELCLEKLKGGAA